MFAKVELDLLISFVDYVRLCYFFNTIGVFWFEEECPLVRDSLTAEFVVVFVCFPFLKEYSDVFFCLELEPVSTTNGL